MGVSLYGRRYFLPVAVGANPPPDHIIIETSGLALPQPLVQAFGWPDIRAQVMLDGVVTLVDGRRWLVAASRMILKPLRAACRR